MPNGPLVMPANVDARSSHRPIFAVGAVLFGAFLANFDSRLFSVGLPDLRGAYSLSFDEGAWLSTAATASQIFIAPAVAWMCTVFGLRKILAIPSVVYAAISIVMPLTDTYGVLIALSILHGLLLGTFVPATLLIVVRNLPRKWWIVAMAIYSARVGLSLNAGISIVGFYVSDVGWHWLFWQDVIIAPLMGICVLLGTPHEAINRRLVAEADWGGMLLLGSGMAMIYAGLDQGNRLDWLQSGAVVALLSGGAALSLGFLLNEALIRKPWARIDVILTRNICLALIVILLYTLTALSNASLVPNFLISIGRLRPEQTGGLFLTFGVLPMLILLPSTIYLVQRHDPRLVLIVGLAAFGFAGILGTGITHQWSVDDFIPILLLQALGHSFSLLPLMMIALASSDPTRSTEFAAYVQVMRLGGAEIGMSVMATWLRVREQFHSNLLGQYIDGGKSDVMHFIARLTEHFAFAPANLAPALSIRSLVSIVQQEANTLAYIDGFWLTALFAGLGLGFVTLMTRSPPGPFSSDR
ncbi:MFS transporter [Bradyrhizobium sp. WYCCWR 13023]|uniref:MFS transporter n=1 Tax=Bradyrhizobium zhengyangense TaxID=2911009 RepID=A0A9X1U644_9BRAD|nr:MULTISPECIES: MFS transporter [Bradyrhizobium]MCG2626280.1 MFS transporter [Bradyrhizobium zhengyangense]MCG2644708.1 MFS transporter [Bradyrhizobium zhengyangense]MCG2668288.1 MFS transporter [Bradyrhizobium zhengyangense]MDA9521308.1 arabinose ABC transporter permease [Bradyrhizobium sp. CCBAU 11434]